MLVGDVHASVRVRIGNINTEDLIGPRNIGPRKGMTEDRHLSRDPWPVQGGELTQKTVCPALLPHASLNFVKLYIGVGARVAPSGEQQVPAPSNLCRKAVRVLAQRKSDVVL